LTAAAEPALGLLLRLGIAAVKQFNNPMNECNQNPAPAVTNGAGARFDRSNPCQTLSHAWICILIISPVFV
jgi:hypothetical protein